MLKTKGGGERSTDKRTRKKRIKISEYLQAMSNRVIFNQRAQHCDLGG